MPEPVERSPVEDRLPWCYTVHRGDGECAACPLQAACARATESNSGRRTVVEAAAAAVEAHRAALGVRAPHPDELVRLAAASSGAPTVALRAWLGDRAWLSAMEVVLAACRDAGWDPRTYVRAQGETVGAYAIERGWPVRPGMFVGPAAPARFERWAARNARKYGDARADRRVDAEREALVAGEGCFAERYLSDPGETIEGAEEFARGMFPSWELARTEGRDDVRLPALAGALASLDPGLPHRMLAPAGPWGWPEARDAALALTRLGDAPENRTFEGMPSELGEVV